MKKIFAGIMASAFVFGSGIASTFAEVADSITLSASAAETTDSGECGENLTWTLDAEGTLTISGTGDMYNYSVSTIPWDEYRDSIKNVVIEKGVLSIGSEALYDCAKLTSITLPDSVTSIGSYVFYSCSSLTSITIPDSVTSIGNMAFFNCSRLNSITILNPDCEICDSESTISNGRNEESENNYFSGTIHGYEGSTAQVYAQRYRYNFESLSEAPVTAVKGDVDGDGKVAISDATMTLTIYANKAAGNSIDAFTEAQIKAADVNGDGSITIADATEILKIYAESAVGK